MRDYVFTSNQFGGEILFSYDSEGMLVKYENKAELTDDQALFLSRNFPLAESDLHKIKGKTGKITEVTDLSFERFWNEYDFKMGNKKKAQELWRKLSEGERIAVFEALPRYNYFLKINQGIMKAYPTTFLNQRRWENKFV